MAILNLHPETGRTPASIGPGKRTAITTSGLLAAIAALVIAGSYFIVQLPPDTGRALLREDGPIESATAVFFLGACLGFHRIWTLRGRSPARPGAGSERRIFFLILAFLMFVCMGEEISWGQRIFGWKTPEGWSAKNAQSETNLHNLAIIEGGVRDPQTQSFLRSLTNANRVFALFWLTFFIAVPLLVRASPAARSFASRLGLPVPSLWFGALFLLNHAAFFLANQHLVALHQNTTTVFPLDELKEQNDALVYAVSGLVAWLHTRV